MDSLRSRSTRSAVSVLAASVIALLGATPPPPAAPSTPGGSTGWPPTQSGTLGIGIAAPSISLADTQGNGVAMSQFAGKPVALIWIDPLCRTCSDLAQKGLFASTVSQAMQADPSTVVLFVNSHASLANTASVTRSFLDGQGISARALLDPTGATAKSYGVLATPHCFVIDTSGAIRYAGAIDDQGGTNHLVSAIKALKERRAVSPTVTKPYGTPFTSK